MAVAEIVIAGLAVWQIIEIWRHGSLFAEPRARIELWDGVLGTLLRCGFCLAPWVAWLIVTPPLFLEPFLQSLDDPWRRPGLVAINIWRWIVYGFAVSRLANLGNDLTHAWCRTPDRHHDVPFDEESISQNKIEEDLDAK